MKQYSAVKLLSINRYRLILTFILVMSIVALGQAQKVRTSTNQNKTKTPSNTWVVKLKAGESIAELAERVGAKGYEQLQIGTLKNYYVLDMSNAESEDGKLRIAAAQKIEGSLKTSNKVVWSERNYEYNRVLKNLNDPLLSDQWHLNNTGQGGGVAGTDVNAFAAWNLGYTGQNVQICIVDDGVDYQHEDLNANFDLSLSWDYNSDEQDPTGVNGDNHGTACAGVAAAIGDNDLGVSGAAPNANLSAIRLIAAAVPVSTEAAALTFGLADNHISSNSWGPADDSTYHEMALIVKDALAEGGTNGRNGLGTIYSWAAGNGRGKDNVNYDQFASSIYTIAVGAHGNDGVVSWYSEPGASMLVTAPSNGGTLGITTTDLTGANGYNNTNYTDDFGGTSSACPLASGVIALMLDANPNLTWRDVQHILVKNGVKVDPTNTDWSMNGAGLEINHNYGFGGLDAAALCQAAATWQNVAVGTSDTLPLVTLDLAIPDNVADQNVTADITVTKDINIEHVELVVEFTHSYAGDLEFVLIAPNGASSTLAETRNVGQNLTNYQHTFMTVRNWGESSLGDWTVQVTDNADEDVGTLHNVQLIIHGVDETAPPICPPNFAGINSLLGTQVADANFETDGNIESTQVISTSIMINYDSGNMIELLQGFEVEGGAEFHAFIDGCNNTLTDDTKQVKEE